MEARRGWAFEGPAAAGEEMGAGEATAGWAQHQHRIQGSSGDELTSAGILVRADSYICSSFLAPKLTR